LLSRIWLFTQQRQILPHIRRRTFGQLFGWSQSYGAATVSQQDKSFFTP
jgi:hypothetical protein